MSKRPKSGNNTLFNYFSPTSKSTNNENSINKANLKNGDETPKKPKIVQELKVQEKRPAQSDSDDDEPIQATKRKKRIITMDSSDSDSDNDNQSNTTEEPQISKGEEIRKKLAELPATPSRKKESKSPPRQIDENSVLWLHEKLDFLQPSKIRDADRRRPDDPNYNPRTLYVPQDFLNKCTPGMRQWWEIKSKLYDCVLFFKVGKFYELYHMDAVLGVNELALTFMKGEFAHSGFPEIAYGRFSTSLVELGYKVARVEQTETPEMLAARLAVPGTPKTKFDKVVRREVCQVTDRATRVGAVQDADITSVQSDHLYAIFERKDNDKREIGVCFVDTAVGLFHLGQFEEDQHYSNLLTLFSEYPPAAILEERGNLQLDTKSLLKTSLGNVKFEILSANKEFYSAQKTIEALESGPYFKTENKDSVEWPEALRNMVFEGNTKCSSGKPEFSLALKCLGAVHFYLKTCLLDIQLFSLRQVKQYEITSLCRSQKHMVLDSNALKNLHILGTEHSLQSALDRCGFAGGKRLLKQWICRPLCDIKQIKLRQKAIQELTEQSELLRELSSLLGQLPDLERDVAKIHTLGNYVRSRTHPDGRAILYEETKYSSKKINDFMNTLNAFQKCCIVIKKCEALESELLKLYGRKMPEGRFPDITETLNYFDHAFDHAEAKKLGKIMPRPGVDEDYDRTLEKLEELKRFGEEYLEEQEKFFGCKVVFFGKDKKRFQLEVPEKQASKRVNEDYKLEGTKKGAKPCNRYSTEVTRKLLADTMAAEKENKDIIHDLNRKIFEKFSTHYDTWMEVCNCMSVLDCLVSLAVYATSQTVEMCAPEILSDKEAYYEVEDGVHPFIPHIEDFIPNSVQLGCGKTKPQLMIITGANMGGKTTLMRQTALHAIMAQMGSLVPAKSLKMSLVDRVFTRLGARDDIMAGRSTFHVELREALTVLQHATANSLVLLDELGRGTSTHDGSAIAASYVRDLARIKCRAVFSTHYHGVMSRFVQDPLVQVCHMACQVENGPREGDDDQDNAPETVTFLYKIKEGACPRSYGFNAARLAGLTHSIIQRGQVVSKNIERETLCRKLFVRLFQDQDDIKSVLSTLKSLQL